MSGRVASVLVVLATGIALSGGAAPEDVVATMEVSPMAATVGEHLAATVFVRVPADLDVVTAEPGASLGRFEIVSGRWTAPPEGASPRVFRWDGVLAAYETGELSIPPFSVELRGTGGSDRVATDPVTITITSVLPPGLSEPSPDELADLKPPASVEPDFGPLILALVALASLLLLAGVVWWLHRRYAARLAAVPAPDDPFRRTPPHVWVYAELQRLLDARLAEEGQVDRFFSELSRIVKTYLTGRYRIELMERTTEEVVPLLAPAGVPDAPARTTRSVLELCDRVKFARETPDAAACRAAVDEAYRIADATRPRETPEPAESRGAA